ncbi:hypothetical protein GN956_G24526 [Arapaima gigas]
MEGEIKWKKRRGTGGRAERRMSGQHQQRWTESPVPLRFPKVPQGLYLWIQPATVWSQLLKNHLECNI